jgi:hypothetical protein
MSEGAKMKKVYQIDKDLYSIGVFDGDELLKGNSPKYFKTEKGALKALKRILRGDNEYE